MRMKHVLAILLLSLCLSVGIAACSTENHSFVQQPAVGESEDNEMVENKDSNDISMDEKISIKIGGASYEVTLQDNATAKAFRSLLPLTVIMNEHAGNEKYYNLPNQLPADISDIYYPGTIQVGDLMLWGSDCVVLFYKTFSTSYGYTRIGKLDDPADLPKAVGSGKVTVTFE